MAANEVERGVYRIGTQWFYRHYGKDAPTTGPYKTKAAAMEALLIELAFPIEED